MALLLRDDFSDGDDAGWIQVNRSWHVVGGRYHLDGCYGCDGVPTTGARDGFAYTHVGDLAWTDYTYEFTFDTTNAPSVDNDQWAGTSDAHHAMAFFRVQPPLPDQAGAATQYRVDFWSEGQCCHAERVDLIKNVAGSGELLVSAPTSGLIRLGMNRGRVVAIDGRIQISVNSRQVIDYTDPDPIPFGGVGVGAIWEVNAWFDDITVTAAARMPSRKDDCKNGGWRFLTDAAGNPFKNQGDCIQFVNAGK